MNQYYDLMGPKNEILLPENWSATIRPGWVIVMVLWPPNSISKAAGERKDWMNVAAESRTLADIPPEISKPMTSRPISRPINEVPQANLGRTPLHEAVLRGHRQVVELLLR